MRRITILLIGLGILYGLYSFFREEAPEDIIQRLEKNYGADINQICNEMNLPPEYFKALVILESSAERPAKTRFEPHVYEKLKAVQMGKVKRYGSFTKAQMQLLSDQTLKKLATSWGPIQIMGYHCIPMGIQFEELVGEESLLHGIQWANRTYGKYLEERDFSNAFHIHNTGKPLAEDGVPKTYDPDYIRKGLELIQKFK